MIRINLSSLAPPKTKRGKRSAAPTVSMPGEGPGFLILAVVFVAGMIGACAVLQVLVNRQNDNLQKELTKALIENRRLADVKAKYEASKRKSDLLERRGKVIDDLKAAQKGPVDMLNVVADTVNKTDAVWLDTMTTDGKSVNFTGMALSADAVADLIANLRKTGAFRTVEIKETAQDSTVKEVQAFKFELICEIGAIGASNKAQKQS